jgi:hypothetical protein
MKILTIYLENSVIGGYFDDEFNESSMKLFDEFKKGLYKPVISSHVIAELEKGAPQYVKDNLETLDYDKIILNEEMIDLADKYMEAEIITSKYYDDAVHIAIATVSNVDLMVSWNFKHIVNFNKIKLFNSVNIKEGYNILEIRTPQEVINYE